MNKRSQDLWAQARARYEAQPLPEELDFAVASAIRAGERRRRRQRTIRRGLATGLAACACFVLLVNASPEFARAVEQVPVLGSLARIVTVEQYRIEDPDRLIDVRLPALENTGHTDLEQRVNTEIRLRIDQVIADAEERARQAKEAFVDTGGDPAAFIPILINVDYQVKCQNGQYLSFVVETTETQASAYTQLYTYNIDLTTGRELTLRDLLGDDYMELANQAIQAEIDRRSTLPDYSYFDPDIDGVGFQGIADDQPFYINQAGNPVIVFAKYEIAPGYMGKPEFEIPCPAGAEQ